MSHPKIGVRVLNRRASWMHEKSRANGPTERCNWAEVDWAKAQRVVKNLRQRIFRAEMLEPCAVEVASTVLRGAGGGNVTCLPGLRCEVAWWSAVRPTLCPRSSLILPCVAGNGGV